MIQCPKCGQSNPDDANNCSKCRINLEFAVANRPQFVNDKLSQQLLSESELKLQGRITSLVLTTTPIIQGRDISKYIEVVRASVALGTGSLSELGADLSDVFGTRAGGIQEKLDRANECALQEIRVRAASLNADAVIGLSFGYFSHMDKIIVVNVFGTAVQLAPVGTP